MLSVQDHSRNFLREIPFFKSLTDRDFKECYQAAQIRNYAKHKPICFQNDVADRFFVMYSGWVKLYRNTEDGKEAIISLVSRGDVFGKANAFFQSPYPFSAEAANNSRIIEIPANIFREMVKNNPEILNKVIEDLTLEMKRLALEKEHMTLMNVSQRVGCLLVQLSASMQGRGGTLSFPYEKSLAAARLGMTAESFSRALRDLSRLGVEIQGTEVTINDFSRLARGCCTHCSAMPEDCKAAYRKTMWLPESRVRQRQR